MPKAGIRKEVEPAAALDLRNVLLLDL